ncbi:MAG: tetratricopeptide repeat protein [Acidobacteria bacterium]|nr:tetratricopeptide repeat protein [Acidobacteriota bacterium]
MYARLGRTEEAIQCFRRVADAYAADGFTVKAIAMYKKVTKLTPNSTDCIRKLAELYSQQGLNNDARVQYLQLADQFLRVNDHEQASKTFERLLDLDPENTTMQSRLADLYVKLGRQPEARAIYFRAAEMHARQDAPEAAEQALQRALAIDPEFGPALIMRARVLYDSGRYEDAVQCLERVRDRDSQPEALRVSLRAHVALKNLGQAVPLAGKLVTVHNDVSGVTACADAMIRAGECETALRLYAQHADRLLATNARALIQGLQGTIDDVKHNPAALDMLRSLYEKAGETTHLNEINELLAHALVQSGDLARARDLYKQLAEVEPDNPVHLQNYNQVRERMGENPQARAMPAGDADAAFMVDELESSLVVETSYPREVMEAVKSAITDSELLDSYNLQKKALAPLEAVLPEAPLHPMLNQRLASLYAREERFSEAARCCDVLRAVYWNAGHTEHALRYADMATRYRDRIGEKAPEFSIDAILNAHHRHFPAAEETTDTFAAPEEIDISHEWESLLVDAPTRPQVDLPEFDIEAVAAALMEETQPRAERVSTQAPVKSPPAEKLSVERGAKDTPAQVAVSEPHEKSPGVTNSEELAAHLGAVADLVEEIRFYISQQMPEEAEAAIERCHAMAPELSDLDDLRREVEAIKPVPGTQPGAITEPVLDVPAATAAPIAAGSGNPLDELVFGLEESLPVNLAPGVKNPAAGHPGRSGPQMREASGLNAPAPESATAPAVTRPQAASVKGNGAMSEGSSLLADLFEEFKEEVEHESHPEQDDPETHYNLAVAFREMGLLDEAIGEFQKVCQSFEMGHAFPRVIETYTWLAQCLVDKGMPQAAIRWYEKALKVPGVNSDAVIAVHYDMACAFEAAGNSSAALAHFMDVYGTNIDYRDVAERIKSLQRS